MEEPERFQQLQIAKLKRSPSPVNVGLIVAKTTPKREGNYNGETEHSVFKGKDHDQEEEEEGLDEFEEKTSYASSNVTSCRCSGRVSTEEIPFIKGSAQNSSSRRWATVNF